MFNGNIKRIQIIELWDSVLFKIFNLVNYLGYIFGYLKINKIISKNGQLKGRHEGERCFIVFGGPSLSGFDFNRIRGEIVCCVNHFYHTKEYDIVKPSYYFASDTNFFSAVKGSNSDDNYIKKIIEKTRGSAKCVFSHKAIPLHIEEDHVYITYSHHKSTKNSIRSNLDSISSNFGSVSMFAINCAIYMGFKEVYLLGYDFPPGNMPHFYKESEVEVSGRGENNRKGEMYEVCELHWQYYQAQVENYYLADHALKNGVAVYNCNKLSNVRAFEFKELENVLNQN